MYYRRKCLLAIIERFDRSLEKIALQKLLFLLGQNSACRQSLVSQNDYDLVFATYEKEVLPLTHEAQTQILKTLATEKRVAVTCFEKDLHKCHRTRLIKALKEISRGDLEVEHL